MTNWSKVWRGLTASARRRARPRRAARAAGARARRARRRRAPRATSGPSTAAAHACSSRPKRSATHARISSGASSDERVAVDLAGLQGLEPLVPGGVGHGVPQLGADAAPGWWELVVGHGRAAASSLGEATAAGWTRGPAEARQRRT